MKKVRSILKSFAAGLTIVFAMLAITDIQYLSENPQDHLSRFDQFLSKQKLKDDLAKAEDLSLNADSIGNALSESLGFDQIGDDNPFSQLTPLDPLNKIMKLGVSTYHRETFRSPKYKDDSGYDMIHYTIQHFDGKVSQILAFVDQTKQTKLRNVWIITPGPDSQMLILNRYENFNLVETQTAMGLEFDQAVAQKINEAVPFLSVAR